MFQSVALRDAKLFPGCEDTAGNQICPALADIYNEIQANSNIFVNTFMAEEPNLITITNVTTTSDTIFFTFTTNGTQPAILAAQIQRVAADFFCIRSTAITVDLSPRPSVKRVVTYNAKVTITGDDSAGVPPTVSGAASARAGAIFGVVSALALLFCSLPKCNEP